MALPVVLLLWLAALLAPPAGAACPGRSLLANATAGLISTWRTDAQYRSHAHCEWIITAPPDRPFISLRVQQFETECSFDFVYLYDGCDAARREMAALSGDFESLSRRSFTASSGCLHVHFVSDMDYRRRGFEIAYSTATCPERCGNFPCNATGQCVCPAGRRGDACEFSVSDTCPPAVGRWDAGARQCVCKNGRAGFNCSLALSAAPGSWHDLRDASSHLFAARAHFASAQTGDVVFVHGGRSLGASLSDLLRFTPGSWPAWTRLSDGRAMGNSSTPSPRHGHAMWLLDGDVYVYGGTDLASSAVYGDLWRYSVTGGVWRRIEVRGESPRLYFFTATVVERSVFLIGGQTPDGSISGATFSLTIDRGASVASCGRLRPRYGVSPRLTGHTAVYHPRRQAIVVFGGFAHTNNRHLGVRTNAMHMLSVLDKMWTALPPPSPKAGMVPHETAFHAAVRLGEDYMAVTGGSVHMRNSKEICKEGSGGRVFFYHLGCHQWLSIPPPTVSGPVPSFGRFGHGVAVLRGNVLLQMGGFAGDVIDRLDAWVVPPIVARQKDSSVDLEQHCSTLAQCTSDPACAVCHINGREVCVPVSKSTASCKRHPCPGLCPLLMSCFECLSFRATSDFFAAPCNWCSVAATCHNADKPSPEICSKNMAVSWWRTPEIIADRAKCITALPPAGAHLFFFLPPARYSQPDFVFFINTFDSFNIPRISQWRGNLSDPYVGQAGQNVEVWAVTTIAPLLNLSYFGAKTSSIVSPIQLHLYNSRFKNVSMELSTDEDPAHKVVMSSTLSPSSAPTYRFGLQQPFPHGAVTYWLALRLSAPYVSHSLGLHSTGKMLWVFADSRVGAQPVTGAFLRPVRRPNACQSLTNCAACAANAACGWCRSAGRCQARWDRRAAHCLSPIEEVVTVVAQCPNCSSHLDCRPCAQDPLCEWSAVSSLCVRRGRFPNASVTHTDRCASSCVKRASCGACMARADCAWCSTTGKCYPFAWQVWNLLADCVSWQNRMPCQPACGNASASCEQCFRLQSCAWRFNRSASHEGACEAWPGAKNRSVAVAAAAAAGGEVAYAECPPVDECALGLGANCKANSSCIDLRHGYRCQCNEGFEGNGEVACSRTCFPACVHGRCSGPPHFRCLCSFGFTGANCSRDCGCYRHATCSGGPGKCDRCANGTEGAFCDRCLPGHFGNATGPAGCAPCECHGHGRPPQLCDAATGRCFCRHNTEGDRCERCRAGYTGQPQLSGQFCFATCQGRRLIRNLTAGLTDFVGWKAPVPSSSAATAHCDWLFEVNNASPDASSNASSGGNASLIVARVHRLVDLSCSRGAVFLHSGVLPTSRPLPRDSAAAAKLGLLGVLCERPTQTEFESRSGRLHLHFLLETGVSGGGASSSSSSLRPEFVLNYTLLRCPDCGLGRVCREGRCECPEGRHGLECALEDCPGNCTPPNGVCREGACRCAPQWSGADCSQPVRGPTVSFVNKNLSALFGHSLVRCGGAALLFGGESSSGLPSSALLRLSEDELSWSEEPCTAECPPAMAWHAAVCDEEAPDGPRMLVVGPSDGAIWRYKVAARRWSRLSLPWPLTGGVLGHSLTLAEASDGGRRIYLVGGLKRRSGLDQQWAWNEQVWVLNASASGHKVATIFDTVGQTPGGVFGHTTAVGSNTKNLLFVIGGFHSSRVIREGVANGDPSEIDATPVVSSDVYALQLSSGKWYLMPTPRNVGVPQPHAFASAVRVGHSQALIHGGIDKDGKPLSDEGVHVYDLLCNAWSEAKINWTGIDPEVRQKAMVYAGALVPSSLRSGRFLLVGGALAGQGSGLTLAFEHLSGPPHGLSLRAETVSCSGLAATVEDCGAHLSCRHCRAAATPLPTTVMAPSGPRGVQHRACVWCGTCFPGGPACRNGSSCGTGCSVQVGPNVPCAGEESCGDAASCDSCWPRWPGCEWSRARDLCLDTRAPLRPKDGAKPSCLSEGCLPSIGCERCVVEAVAPCAFAPHLGRCLKSAAVPLRCAAGRCGAVFERSCPRWERCANISVCAKCLAVPGCGWVAMAPNSLDGRGECRPGGFGGPTSCPLGLAGAVCRAGGSRWAFAHCPAENECRNGHHTCDSRVQDCVDTPQGFRCPCKTGYKLQGGTCRPQCPQGCVPRQGTCVRPDVCECAFGYTGRDCGTQCECNGHSDCRGPGRAERQDCLNCTHNTMGKHCEFCKPNFVGNPLQNLNEPCIPCREFCHGHSHVCRSRSRFSLASHGPKREEARCDPCANNTQGSRCMECRDGFFRREKDKWQPCRPCQCNGHDWQCDADSGINCHCQNNTRTPDKCSDKGKLNPSGVVHTDCYKTQCSICKDYFLGRPTEGRQCYRTMSMEHQYCLDFFSDQAQCGLKPSRPLPPGKTVFFVVQPKYMNVDIRVVVDMREGEVDFFASWDNRRFIVSNDPGSWDHRVTVSPQSSAAPQGGGPVEQVRRRKRAAPDSGIDAGRDPLAGALPRVRVINASRILTHARFDPQHDVLVVRGVATRLVLFISRTEHDLKSRRFYLLFRGASASGAQGKVLFRQDQVHIDLFVFFSVFFACFFLLLGAFIVAWKCKQVMDFRRTLEREAKARQTMASRPFATVYVALDRRPPSAEESSDKAEFSPVPVAVEPTDDGIACVGTLLMQLPGPVISLGSGLMTMRVMYPSGKQGGARRRTSLSNC